MANELIKKDPSDGGFAGWSDSVQGHDAPASAGLIRGMLTKFSNSAAWLTRDEEELSEDRLFIATSIARAVQKWKNGKPVETIVLEPGQDFPDVEAMNAEIPQTEWEQGPDGKPRGPWQAQHFLYLLDPETMEQFTFPTGTVGGAIAIRDLRDKLVWMRRNRGDNIYAVITLSNTFMKTRFGGRQRPDFKIVQWTRLGGEQIDAQALPPPTTLSPAATLVPVQEPSIEEDFDDELPGDLAPPKPAPAKAATNRKRTSTPEAA